MEDNNRVQEVTETVEQVTHVKANDVGEDINYDGDRVWVLNHRDQCANARAVEAALDALTVRGVESVDVGNLTLSFRNVSDLSGERRIFVEYADGQRSTSVEKLKELLDYEF